jgi:predicted nucleic acid-binding protein
MSVVLCNSGPLMALGKLNRLDLLAELYSEVQVPKAVYNEVVSQGLARGAPDALIARLFWQRQRWPVVEVAPEVLSAYEPPVILDPGEREVLALAQTLADPLVLLDDEVARAEARRLELRVRGTSAFSCKPTAGGCFLFHRLNGCSTRSQLDRTSGSAPSCAARY